MTEINTMRDKGIAIYRYLRDRASEPATMWEIARDTGLERRDVPAVIVWLRIKAVDIRATLDPNTSEGVYWLASREDPSWGTLTEPFQTFSRDSIVKVGPKPKPPKVARRRTPKLTALVRAEALAGVKDGSMTIYTLPTVLGERHGLTKDQVRDAIWNSHASPLDEP